MTSFPTWTPRDGDIIHVRFPDTPALTGRFTVEDSNGGPGRFFNLRDHRDNTVTGCIRLREMQDWHEKGLLTPIDPAEIERDRKALELRSLAPLKGRRNFAQDDVDGLALFDAHRSPTLEL